MIGQDGAHRVDFSAALRGSEAERHTAFERAFHGGPFEATAIETFFELFDRLAELPPDTMPRTRRNWIVYDISRVIVFRDSGIAGEPGITSLIRFLLDGYPLQPFARFAAIERGRPYRFAFDPAALELIPRCLADTGIGEYSVVDFLSGEILRARLHRHPQASPPKLVQTTAPPAGSPLRPVTTGRNLRSASPPELGPLIEPAAGIIRSEDIRANVASLASASTQISGGRGARREFCSGQSASVAHARSVARCEAIERFQVAKQASDVDLVRASYAEVADMAVDPRALFFGRSPECPDDRGIPFDPNVPICWTWAWGPAEHRWRLVPAQEIWFNTAHLMSEPQFVYSTTSGCAVGATVEEAAIFAVLEAIERDGFLTSWYLRRPATEIDVTTFASEEAQLLVARFHLAFPGYRAVLFDLTSDVGIPTVCALAIRERGKGPRTISTAAADIHAEAACFRALNELCRLRPELESEQAETLRERLTNPDSIVGPEGHMELYSLDESFRAFDYLQLGQRRPVAIAEIGAASPVPPDRTLRLDALLELLDERLRRLGGAVYIKDVTQPPFAEYGVRAVRAITPGLYPIWFGGRLRRFAITERLHRLAELYTGSPFRRDRLQLAPHPMT